MITFFIAFMVGRGRSPMILCRMPSHPSQKMSVSCCVWIYPCSFASNLLIFTSANQHYVLSWWHSHVGQCRCCWPHSSGLGFTHCIILGGGCNISSGKKTTLILKFIPCKLVSPFGHWHIWVSTSTRWQFFHYCANMAWATKGFQSPPLLVVCAFYKQRV
jgi:hypothetical protein